MTRENRKTHAKHFDGVHAAQLHSRVLRDIWRKAYGGDYPEQTNPSAFYSKSTLQRLVTGLRVGPGQKLVDLGCGNGGAALWVARELGVDMTGIDLSAAGVAAGNDQAKALGVDDRVRFIEGDMTETGLPTGSCNGAISLDVLCFVPDKPAAFRETARLLRPGARFGFTTWEQEGYSERLKAQQMTDHRPALESAGFGIEFYDEPANWREQQEAALEGILASQAELEEELGHEGAAQFKGLATGMLGDMPTRRYVSVLARRV
jgi:ubiquinone/menaquinone biosynthesis C-methylase UbiE